MKLISFSRFSRNTFIPLCVPVFSCIKTISFHLMGKENFFRHLFFHIGIISTSETFSAVFYIISLCRQHRMSNLEEQKKDLHLLTIDHFSTAIKVSECHFEPQKKHKLKYILLIICASLLEFFNFFFSYIIGLYNHSALTSFGPFFNLIQIILLIFFSKILLDYSFYRHHFLGIIIFIMGIFVYYENRINFYFSLETCIILLTVFFPSLQYVLEKCILSQNFISPYKLLFYEGSIGIFVTFILAFISSYTLEDEHSNIVFLGTIFENLKKVSVEVNENKILILYIMLLLISSLGYSTFSLLTIYYYTPTYIYITENISIVLMDIIELIMDYDTLAFDVSYFMSILGGIFLLIGSLIFNEIITFHFCGLDYNTKEEIEKRAFIFVNENEWSQLIPKSEEI